MYWLKQKIDAFPPFFFFVLPPHLLHLLLSMYMLHESIHTLYGKMRIFCNKSRHLSIYSTKCYWFLLQSAVHSIFSTDPSIDLESDRSQKKQVLSLIIDRDVHMWAIISIFGSFCMDNKKISIKRERWASKSIANVLASLFFSLPHFSCMHK